MGRDLADNTLLFFVPPFKVVSIPAFISRFGEYSSLIFISADSHRNPLTLKKYQISIIFNETSCKKILKLNYKKIKILL
jgi:hypothetical protein